MQNHKPVRFRFGRFEANLLTRSLFEDGKRIPLQEKPFELLAAVLMGLGNVVSRREVAAVMWPHTHVQTDQGLNAATRKVRLALGDSPDEPKYIETLGSRGYRFIHPFEIIETIESLAGEHGTNHLRIAVLPTDHQHGVLDEQAAEFHFELSAALKKMVPHLTIVGVNEIGHRNLEGHSIGEIGREFEVEFAVSARLRQQHDRIRLTAMLYQSDDTQCIWAETYENTPEEFARNCNALAEKVARSLCSKMVQVDQ